MDKRGLGAGESSRGGCQPLRSFRTADAARAVGAYPRLCRCGFWHRDYTARLPREVAVPATLTATLGEVSRG